MTRSDNGRRTILVTGAAGGLGTAVTKALVARGATVCAADKDLRRVVRAATVIPLEMDVTDGESICRGRRVTEGRGVMLDGVVCAAGVYAGGPLVEVPESEVAHALDVNVMGAFRVIREFLPLIKRPGGRIVLISSEATRIVVPFTGPYAMSKKAVEAFADALRRELAVLGVGVAVVQPGAFRTPLLEAAGTTLERESRPEFRSPMSRAHSVLAAEIKKGMDPERVAGLIVRVLERRRLRPRYRIGNDPLRALLGKAPARWADAVIRLFMVR